MTANNVQMREAYHFADEFTYHQHGKDFCACVFVHVCLEWTRRQHVPVKRMRREPPEILIIWPTHIFRLILIDSFVVLSISQL